MKKSIWQRILAGMAIGGMAVAGSTVLAQSSPDTNTTAVSAPAIAPVPAPASQLQLAYGVPQVVQLTQAKIGDETIVAYIKNSGISYNLDANQIIYLRQQGVSDAVITMMLNQPRAGIAPAPSTYTAPQTAYNPPPAAYAPSTDTVASTTYPPTPTTTAAPSVTYIQSAPPATYYYSSPYYYPDYGYYPAYGYGYYPPVSLSLGWGWGWGGGWHGGWGGGWHGGGGFHGGRR